MSTNESPDPALVVPDWTIGDRLRKAREFAGIGVGEIADRLGVDPKTISRWERSDHAATMTVRLYAIETGVAQWWIEGAEDDAGPPPPTPPTRRRGRRGSGATRPVTVGYRPIRSFAA